MNNRTELTPIALATDSACTKCERSLRAGYAAWVRAEDQATLCTVCKPMPRDLFERTRGGRYSAAAPQTRTAAPRAAAPTYSAVSDPFALAVSHLAAAVGLLDANGSRAAADMLRPVLDELSLTLRGCAERRLRDAVAHEMQRAEREASLGSDS